MKKLAMIVAFALAAQFAMVGLFLCLFFPLGGTHPDTSFSVQSWSVEAVGNDDSENYAEAAAASAFSLTDDQRKRLVVQKPVMNMRR